MRSTACLLLLYVFQSSAQAPVKHRVLFNRFRMPEIALFVADADGKNERALPHKESEYSPSLTPDGKWIVFTSERAGQSDIYRMHPDGLGLEATDQRSGLRRPGHPVTRWQKFGFHFDPERGLRESLVA